MEPSPIRIAPSIAAFLESGLSILVGTRDRDNVPDTTNAIGIRVAEGGDRLTVFLPFAQQPSWRQNLDDGGPVAIVAARPGDHRSIQAKGRAVRVAVAESAAERAFVEAYRDAFAGHLEEVGMPRHLTRRLAAWPCLAVEVVVEELYDQTPGPGAGAPVAQS